VAPLIRGAVRLAAASLDGLFEHPPGSPASLLLNRVSYKQRQIIQALWDSKIARKPIAFIRIARTICHHMQGLWATSAASLLDVVAELRGRPTEAGLSRLSRGRIRAAGPAWPGVLTRLSGIEAALLQDVMWWGPVMEEQLHLLWIDEQEFPSQEQSMAAR
jgi:hypothetical protein